VTLLSRGHFVTRQSRPSRLLDVVVLRQSPWMSPLVKSRISLLVVDGFAPLSTVLEHCIPGLNVGLGTGRPVNELGELATLIRSVDGWRLRVGGDTRHIHSSQLVGALQDAFGTPSSPVRIPETRLRVPREVVSAALELARGCALTTAEVWLLVAATRAPRGRDLAKHLGLAIRTVEGRSAEIRAKSGRSVRDLVLEVFWIALGDLGGLEERDVTRRA
jgi:hypothetical protein